MQRCSARALQRLVVLLPVLVFGVSTPIAERSQFVIHAQHNGKPSVIAHVRYIFHGMTVQPPHHKRVRGALRQSLYAAFLIQTQSKQKASLGFRDGTLLHVNERTDVILSSPSITRVKKGEVEQLVAPGTSHQIRTAAAAAAAIGTKYDIAYIDGVMTVTVIEGAVQVSNQQGSVVVKTGEQATVKKGQEPSIPMRVDTTRVEKWASPIPGPAIPLGVNIALDANGGNAYGASSTRASQTGTWSAAYLDDGQLDRGWQSAQGETSNQAIRVRFESLHPCTIIGFFLDCAATGGEPANNALKDFSILGSTEGSGGFTNLLDASCATRDGIQLFPLAAPTRAASIEVLAKNNQGGSDGIAIAEVGVISSETPTALGTPTPIPTSTTPVPPTSTPSPSATPGSGPTTTTLSALPVKSTLFPPDPLGCFAEFGQFTVSATGLLVSETYDLALIGSAGGITLNASVGSMTADGNGRVTNQVFTLPQIPGHESWTLRASPRSGGFAPTTPLATFYTVCSLPSVENPDRTFTVRWGGSGWKPGGMVTLTIYAATTVNDSTTAAPDGSIAPRTISAQCAIGVTPRYVMNGATLDNPDAGVNLPDSLPCT